MRPADLSAPKYAPTFDVFEGVSDASGFVTLAHTGPAIPRSVNLDGRNSAWYPYLTARSETTITVRMLSRADGIPPTAAISVSFDWTCHFA